MALELALKPIYSSYEDFVFEENSNWGGSNPSRSDVTSATIEISQGSTIITSLDVTSDLSGADDSDVLYFTLPYSPTPTTIPDGIYTVTYEVTASGTDYTTTITIATWFEVQASIMQRIAEIPYKISKFPNDCCDSFIKETTCMWMMLQSLIQSSQYGKLNEFEDILDELNQMLDFDSTWQLL